MLNDQVLQLTDQSSLVDVMRQSRLRWFGHVSRMNNIEGACSLLNKTTFFYYSDSKRSRHSKVRKRWQDMIIADLEKCGIRN